MRVRASASEPVGGDRTVVRVAGLDLGGTNIKWAVLESVDGASPAIVDHGARPTRADEGPDVVVSELAAQGRAVVAHHGPIAAVGVGVPGLFDPVAGTIELFPNLPGPWRGVPLRERMSTALALPVQLINDARAFTLAEGTMGAAAGCSSMVGLVLGTGVGGGLLLDGRVHLGHWGTAGEIGHQTIDPDGPRCGCGNRGCVEVFAQAGRLAQLAGQATAADAVVAAGAGDERSLQAIAQVAQALGIALANVVTVFGPERIVIGGGVAAAGDVLLEPVRRAVRERVTLAPADRIAIVAAQLGALAGAIGAALAGLADQPEVRAR
jgi:glucokinase